MNHAKRKKYQKCKETYSSNSSTCIWEKSKYLKSVADDSKIVCDEIINVADNVSTNVLSTVSVNFYNKKVRYKMDYYILHTVLLVIKLLFIVAIICYHYAKHRCKQKCFGVLKR